MSARRPVIGFLAGDFPWDEPPRKIGKLLSSGATARNVSQALRAVGTLSPYQPPAPDAPAAKHRDTLETFLRSIDVLWASAYPPAGPALTLRHELGLPCRAVLNMEGTLPKAAEHLLFPWQSLLRPGDALVFSCRADQAIWRRLAAQSALAEHVVPLPVDTDTFRPRTPHERAAARARLNVSPTVPLLLYVGRLNQQKNLHGLLRLFARVREEIADAVLCLVGEEDDIALGEFNVPNTGYVDLLKALAAELGVAPAVRFAGPLFGDELAQTYAAADVLVNAGFYHRENFGLSQAEAQACGVPVVCSDWGGFRDVVAPNETGFLVETVLTRNGVRVDWRAGARHVVRLLTDAGLREQMGARAVERARERFGVEAVGRLLAQVVEESGPIGTTAATAFVASPFARRYEAHKRACGWYGPPAAPSWRPALFGGRDYALYETLMRPYATRLAAELPAHAIAPTWTPYLPAPVALDPPRRFARSRDPIWPHARFLPADDFDVLRRVDGTASVAALGASAAAALWRQHVEGFVLFDTVAEREGRNGPFAETRRGGPEEPEEAENT